MSGALLVALGAAVGAPARYLVDRAVRRRWPGFPWGTLTVNALGSLVLGAVVGAGVGERWLLLLGTGLCGAFTTCSTFSWETLRLAETGKPRQAAANVALSLALGLAAFALGSVGAEALVG